MSATNDHDLHQRLRTAVDPYLPAAMVIDALLDARNDASSDAERAVLDRGLTYIGHRNLVSNEEVETLLGELATAEAKHRAAATYSAPPSR